MKNLTLLKNNSLRITSFFYLTIIAILFFVGCNKNSNPIDLFNKDGGNNVCDISSETGYTTLTHNGITREYILKIPSTYDTNAKLPLVINFHGFGGCASDHANSVGDLNTIANTEKFIVAYPQGVPGEKGDSYWKPTGDGSQNINDNDVFFTKQLINHIGSNYKIDTNKVYAIGYSNGGMMSYGLACSSGDVIAAIGIMSGIMLPETCNTTDYTSVIHFHGIGDDVLPYNGNTDYQSVQSVINSWLTHNGISSSSLTTNSLNSGNVIQKVYTGGNGNTSVELFTINQMDGKTGGHDWFSGNINGKSTNKILWDFLSKHSLTD